MYSGHWSVLPIYIHAHIHINLFRICSAKINSDHGGLLWPVQVSSPPQQWECVQAKVSGDKNAVFSQKQIYIQAKVSEAMLISIKTTQRDILARLPFMKKYTAATTKYLGSERMTHDLWKRERWTTLGNLEKKSYICLYISYITQEPHINVYIFSLSQLCTKHCIPTSPIVPSTRRLVYLVPSTQHQVPDIPST